MSTLRLGCVQYLNTLPLIEGLSAWRDAELTAAVPSRLIDLLVSRRVDIALPSIIDVAKNPGLVALPVGMIGCDGPTLTVRLFSRVPIERVTRIAADTDSHTSVALAKVLFWKLYNRKIETLDYNAREQMVIGGSMKAEGLSPSVRDEQCAPESILLIGDKVVVDPPMREEFLHELDLGEAWKSLTGLPFVYAAWACRAEDWYAGPESEAGRRLRTAAAMLDRTRRHNATRTAWLAHARAADKKWPADTALTYLRDYLRFEVDEPERVAAEKFVGWASELGLVEGRIRWAEEKEPNEQIAKGPKKTLPVV